MNTGRMSISYAFIPGDKIRDIQSLTLGAAF